MIATRASGMMTKGERQRVRAKTLGDLLYADPVQRATEQEWVVLVQSMAAGTHSALHALYERSHRIVFTLAMRITNDRAIAEEVTVDVFHELWRRASTYDAANGTVVGWIANHTRSMALDRRRLEQRKKRVPPAVDQTVPEQGTTGRQQRVDRRALRRALTVLTPGEREAIEAASFSGLTYSEVAARLHRPSGTVKTRIRTGLARLRQALRDR